MHEELSTQPSHFGATTLKPTVEPLAGDATERVGVSLRLRVPRDSRAGIEGALAGFAALHRLGVRAAFELVGTGAGGEVRLWAERRDHADLIRQQLAAVYPRVSFVEVDPALPRQEHTLAATLGLRHPDPVPLPSLDGPAPMKAGVHADPVAGLLAALDDVRLGETVVFQLVLAPGSGRDWEPWVQAFLTNLEQRRHAPDRGDSIWDLFRKPPDQLRLATADRVADAIRAKLRSPLFAATIRLLASSTSRERTLGLFRNALAPLTGLAQGGLNELVPLAPGRDEKTSVLMEQRASLHQVLLSAHECLDLWHPAHQGMGGGKGAFIRGVELPVPSVVTRSGIRIGYAASAATAEPVALPAADLRRHVAALGATGAGKSTALLTMLLSAIEAGHGCGLIDVKGDLATELLGRIPAHRQQDVVLIDPTDPEYAVGIDLYALARHLDLDLSADFVVSTFQLQYSDNWGIVFPRLLRESNRALLEVPGTTLLDLPTFLRDRSFRMEILSQVEDEAVRDFFFLEFERLSPSRQIQAIGPVLTRTGAALESAFGRYIFGQPGGASLRELMDSNKIVIAAYPAGRIGKQNANLFAGLTAAACQLAGMTRVDQPERDRKDWILICDEAHNYASSSFTQTFSEGRGYGLCLVVATQFLGQVPPEVRSSILANVSTLICFRLGEEDAALVGRRFEPYATRADLTDLDNYTALVRTSVGAERLPPFTLYVRPPEGAWSAEVAASVRELSRRNYGQPKALLDARRKRARQASVAPAHAARWADLDEEEA